MNIPSWLLICSGIEESFSSGICVFWLLTIKLNYESEVMIGWCLMGIILAEGLSPSIRDTPFSINQYVGIYRDDAGFWTSLVDIRHGR